MKKLLIIALLIAGCVFPNISFEDSIQVNEKDKYELFKQKKKSPIVACALSFAPELLASVGAFDPEIYITLYGLPALGHRYSNNWKRGVLIGLGITGICKQGVRSSNPFNSTTFQIRITVMAINDCSIAF